MVLTTKTLDPYKLDSLQFGWKTFLMFYLYVKLSAEKQNRMQVFDF